MKHARNTSFFAAVGALLLASCGGTASPSVPAASAPTSATVAASTSAKPAASAAAPTKPGASGSAAAKASAQPVASEIVNPRPGAGGTKITMCIPARSNNSLPGFAAIDTGLLAQAGIEATMPYFAGGAVDQALAAGQCDFVYGAGGVGALLGGVDVAVIAVTLNKSQLEVWGRPPLKTIADLKGHTVGTTGAGSLSWRLGRYYLRSNGIDPENDAKVLPTGDNAATLAGLLAGRVDSAVLAFPLTAEAKNKGMNLVYKAPDDFEFVAQGVVTTRRYLSSHRDIAKTLVKSVTDSMMRLKSDSSFYATELKKYAGLDVDDATLKEYWTTDAQAYALPPRGTHKGAVTALSLYADDAAIKGQNLDVLADRWIDTSIVDELFPPK